MILAEKLSKEFEQLTDFRGIFQKKPWPASSTLGLQGLGASAMYLLVLRGFEHGLEIRPIIEKPERSVAIAWQNWDTMPSASRRFAEFIMDSLGE